MRIYELALAAGVVALGACGGGDKGAADNSAPKDTTAAAAPAATAAATPAAAPAGGAAAAGAPITGKTVEIKMIGDEKGYRFEPNNVTIKVGDGLKFINVVGGPHNASFYADSIPAGAATALQAHMANTIAPLAGPLLIDANASYVISFAGLKPGTYKFYCTPHAALNMKGTLTVQ